MRLPVLQSDLLSVRDQHQNIKRIAGSLANGLHHATRTLVQRDSADSSSSSQSSSTCKSGDDSPQCTTPADVQNTQNIAIILGVVIPLSCAIAVLIYLHRRHLKKQKMEDLNDPHKSLDFGMDGIEPVTTKGSKPSKGPEMTVSDLGGASSRRNHGLSLDYGMPLDSPYLLPAALNGSKDSLHSMSRGLRDEHDPYRPVTQMRPSMDDDSSVRFGRLDRLNDDKGSLYSASTGHHSALQDRAGLIANARPMSQSFGRRAESMSPNGATSPDGTRQLHSAMNAKRRSPPSQRTSLENQISDIKEEKDLPVAPAVPEPVAKHMPPPRTSSNTDAPRPPRKDSMSTLNRPESSNYGDDDVTKPARITIVEPEPYDIDPAAIYARYSVDSPSPEPSSGLQTPQPPLAGQRLSVMGMRPLPPDVPDDNPEIRANRIRSFYKEYFDDSKPMPPAAQYEEDVYSSYMDGVIYDPETGGFYAPNKPFAQGPARRAMTPPPRGKPRVSGNSSLHPHQRKYSTLSVGRPRGRSLPRKNLPPPKPLSSLPTPYLMKDDSAIFNAADFAPPSTFRNYQNGGRPDSPLSVQRPYSPSVRAFTPLASSFENLAVLPSPHDLRKSGTFTALDFAPPSRIRDPMLSPTETGSIRSNRSGMSQVQKHAVREGAYRVSRIPNELVTTQTDLASQLRPKMNMTAPA